MNGGSSVHRLDSTAARKAGKVLTMVRAMHPLLPKLEAVPTFSRPERLCTLLAAHTAQGDLKGLVLDWQHLPEDWQQQGLEAVLQTHLFAGYPRTINALAALRTQKHGRFDAQIENSFSCNVAKQSESESFLRQGEKLCRQIYGRGYDRLRQRMADLHPALDRWMVEVGYGRVLSRPGLTLRLRELCVLSVLSGQNVAPQLASHLRGALRVGASKSECEAIIAQCRLVWGEKAFQEAEKVWKSIS